MKWELQSIRDSLLGLMALFIMVFGQTLQFTGIYCKNDCLKESIVRQMMGMLYVGESPCSIKCPCVVMAHPWEQDRMRAIVRRCYETANECLKNFIILSEPFRHGLTQNGYIFHACASLVRLSIEHGDPLFPVDSNPHVGIY